MNDLGQVHGINSVKTFLKATCSSVVLVNFLGWSERRIASYVGNSCIKLLPFSVLRMCSNKD
jgi:hypothetical protein